MSTWVQGRRSCFDEELPVSVRAGGASRPLPEFSLGEALGVTITLWFCKPLRLFEGHQNLCTYMETYPSLYCVQLNG